MIEDDVNIYLQRIHDCDDLNDMVISLYEYYRVTGHTIQQSSGFMNLYKKTSDVFEANLKTMVAYRKREVKFDLEYVSAFYQKIRNHGIHLPRYAVKRNRPSPYNDLIKNTDAEIKENIEIDFNSTDTNKITLDSSELFRIADSMLKTIEKAFNDSSVDYLKKTIDEFRNELTLAKKIAQIQNRSKKETSEIDVLQMNGYLAILQADPNAYKDMRMHSRQFNRMGGGEVFGLIEDAQGLYANPKDLDATDIDTFNRYFLEILFTLDSVFVYFYQRGYSLLYTELLGLLLANKYQLIALGDKFFWTKQLSSIPDGELRPQRLGYNDIIDFRNAFNRINDLQEIARYLSANFGFKIPFDGKSPSDNKVERAFMLNLGYVQVEPKKRKGRPPKKPVLPYYVRLDSYRPCFMSHEQRWKLIGTLDSLEEQGVAVDKEKIIEIFDSMDDVSDTVCAINSEPDMKKRYNRIKIVLGHYGFVYSTRNGRTVWTVTKRVKRYFENEYLPLVLSESE